MANKTELFSAEKFVDNLKNEGSKILVTNASFIERGELPPYYNENLFKKGQLFYRKHQWAVLFSKVYGLLSLLSHPIAIKILEMTKKTSEPKIAYQRYLETIFHVIVWYEDDLQSGSRLRKSIKSVNIQHRAATKRAGNLGLDGINQYRLAGTQFGFMGYILIRSKEVGVHNASREELEAFLHFWRVIGYCIGIEDRFNLCRESMKETEEICQELLSILIRPLLLLKDPHSLQLQFTFIKALNILIPNLSGGAWLNFLYKLVGLPDDNENGVYFKLPLSQQLLLRYYVLHLSLLRYGLVRILSNLFVRSLLWMSEFYPIFARYKIGKKCADVNILRN